MTDGHQIRSIEGSLGIGAMTDARWQSFYDSGAAVGLYPEGMDYQKAYTLQFVEKKHAMEAVI